MSSDKKYFFSLIERRKISVWTTEKPKDLTIFKTIPPLDKTFTDIITAEGGTAKVEEFSNEEYLTIIEEAKKYKLFFCDHGNYYDYGGDDKAHFYDDKQFVYPIPEKNILVKDGHFFGIIMVHKNVSVAGGTDDKYFVIATPEDTYGVVIKESRLYSEWGNTFTSERVTLVPKD